MADTTPDGDRLWPGSPTHLRGWDAWLNYFEDVMDDADAAQILRYERDADERKLLLTIKPEICNTATSEIHWLEKHVAQIQSGDTR